MVTLKKIILASFSLLGLGTLAQAQDPIVSLTGTVRDTSGATIEYADVNVVLKDDPGTAQDAITDFFGQYNLDMSTDVEDIIEQEKGEGITIFGNGSDHVGIAGYVNKNANDWQVRVFNMVGQAIAQPIVNYDPFSGRISFELRKGEMPAGNYITQIVVDEETYTRKISISNNHVGFPSMNTTDFNKTTSVMLILK